LIDKNIIYFNMHLSYNFDRKANDSQNYYFYKEGFSAEELDKISKDVADLPWHIAFHSRWRQ